jgi:hypothetical protein
MDKDFRDLLERYKQSCGLTFTVFLLIRDTPEYNTAKQQMQDYLSGRRTEAVTDDSIGMRGEEITVD